MTRIRTFFLAALVLAGAAYGCVPPQAVKDAGFYSSIETKEFKPSDFAKKAAEFAAEASSQPGGMNRALLYLKAARLLSHPQNPAPHCPLASSYAAKGVSELSGAGPAMLKDAGMLLSDIEKACIGLGSYADGLKKESQTCSQELSKCSEERKTCLENIQNLQRLDLRMEEKRRGIK